MNAIKFPVYSALFVFVASFAHGRDDAEAGAIKVLREEAKAFVEVANEEILPVRGPSILTDIKEDTAKAWFTESLLCELSACKTHLPRAMKQLEGSGNKLSFAEGNIFIGVYEAAKFGEIKSIALVDKVGMVNLEGQYLENAQKFKVTVVMHKVGDKWKVDDVVYPDDLGSLRSALRKFLVLYQDD